MVKEAGYTIQNVDATVCLQAPKINPHIQEMKTCLAKVMDLPEEDVSLKATTTEKLGFVGKREGVAAHAVALITREQ